MIDKDSISQELYALLEQKLQGRMDDIIFPPPVFIAMQGEVIDYDSDNEVLIIKFPVLAEQLNPYGTMQGGLIAAAIDNTIGPLSMIVSPPNFTRTMNVKYAKVVSPELEYIYVTAKFIEQKKRQLFFEALVKDRDGNKLASAKSMHWVID